MSDKKLFWSIVAGLCSILIPGLGQLIQGRIAVGFLFFFAAFVLWFFWLGFIIHIWSVFDAIFYEDPKA